MITALNPVMENMLLPQPPGLVQHSTKNQIANPKGFQSGVFQTVLLKQGPPNEHNTEHKATGFSLRSNLVSFITTIVIQFVKMPHLDEIKQKSST